MKNILTHISLKLLLSVFTAATVFLLFLVIVSATKQYFLYRHCEHLVNSSQNLLFAFSGMKEHINETLLGNNTLKSNDLITEIEGFNKDLNLILGDILIPEEFKLSFITQVDLVAITVALRNLQNAPELQNSVQRIELSSQLRAVYAKLNAFHHLITRYTQTQLLGLHRALVGLLGVVIALVSLMLLLINRYLATPILHYCRNLFPKESDTISLFTLHKTIESLADTKGSGVSDSAPYPVDELSRLYRYSSIGHLLEGLSNELTNLSNGTINYCQAVIDLGEDLPLDPDTNKLLQNLFLEEKKLSRLLTRMIEFANGDDTGISKSIPLDTILNTVTELMNGILKSEAIELTVKIDDPSLTLTSDRSDIQLVILSVLQSARAALTAVKASESTAAKQITITCSQNPAGTLLIDILDNGVPWSLNGEQNRNTGLVEPWHSLRFCRDFLTTFGASLTVERLEEEINRCRITLPRLHRPSS